MNNLKHVLKILRNIIMTIICIILLIVIYEFDYVSKSFVRDSHFREYTNGNQQIYFLGTIHSSMSLDSEPFSYLNLKSLIENLKPDVLLIESRPEQLSNGNFADGPPEMLYSHLIADKLGIPVKGVDWWIVNDTSVPNTTNPERDNYINKNILKNVIGHKKVLILMGNAHVSLEQPKLYAAGYKKVSFSEIEKIKLFKINDKKIIYPKGMNYYIKKRIDYEKSCMGTVYKTDIFKKQGLLLIEKLNGFSKTIEQTGETE